MATINKDTVVLIRREGRIADYIPEDANLYGYIKDVDASLENPYCVLFDNGTRSMNLNTEHFDTLSQKASDTEYGMCVYCLDMDTDLKEVHGAYGVGSCCSEEHKEAQA